MSGRAWVLATAVIAACRGDVPAAPVDAGEESGPLRGWHYVVGLDASLATMEVEVCFVGRAPDLLVPGTRASARFATDMRGSSGTKLRRSRKGVDLHELPADDCVQYTVDLDALAQDGGRVAQRIGDSVMARPSAWLWRPDVLPRGAEITARFDLAEGQSVSVPWPTVADEERGPGASYTLDVTALQWLGYVVVGDVAIRRMERAGTQLELVALDDEIACSERGLQAWIFDAVDSVAMLFGGTFPRERLQVVVVPVGGRGGTVYFGMAGRGGGSGVYLLLDREARGSELPGGWTTVHEMLHHGMPFVEEAWMAEGWVSYYTEVMRTRMGHRDEAAGWAKLAEAFARGERGGRGITLQATSDNMHETFAYQRVYWGGAAIAFLTDVALREDSGGKLSLDDAMAELRRCCGDASNKWSAAELLQRLDAWYGKPLFSEIATDNLGKIVFPDVEGAMERLGVSVGYDGEASLDDEHPAAAIRRGIMAPRR